MEAKSIDNLLDELNNVQLSKESMQCISGGGFWDVAEGHAHTACTGSGKLLLVCKDDINYLYFEGRQIMPEQIPAGDRTLVPCS